MGFPRGSVAAGQDKGGEKAQIEAVGAPGGLVFSVEMESEMSLSRGFEFKPGGVQRGL